MKLQIMPPNAQHKSAPLHKGVIIWNNTSIPSDKRKILFKNSNLITKTANLQITDEWLQKIWVET